MAQVIVLGSSLAAADLSVLAGNIQITGAPAINTKAVGANTLGVQRYVLGLGQSVRIDFTTANSTYYAFNLISNLPSNGRYGSITVGGNYTSDASASATEIREGLIASIAGSAAAAGLNITTTNPGGANTYIIVNGNFATTSLRDFSAFQVGLLSNVSVATGTNDAMYIAPNATPATALAGTTTVTITSASAHGLAPGNLVLVKSWATAVLTFKGATASAVAGVLTRVLTVPTGTTFTLEGVTATGANSGTIEIYKIASQPMGTPAAVQSELNASLLADGTITAPTVNTAFNYNRVAFTGNVVGAGLPTVLTSQDIVIYWAGADVASPWAVTTSGGVFETQLISLLNGITPGSSVASPALLEASSGTTL